MDKKLQVWWIPQIPMKAIRFPVNTIREAKLLLSALAKYDEFQFKHDIKPDYCNAGGLEVFEEGEWCTWYNDQGDEIDDCDDDGNTVEEE